jgi:hypothetical protein
MDEKVREAVRRRAGRRCEYCLLPESMSPVLPFQLEHVLPRAHGGSSSLSNLALACHYCNLHKGPNLAGIDRRTRRLVRLYHPRRMLWVRHFRWRGPALLGRTPIGRATIVVLRMNSDERIELRQTLMDEGLFL